MMPAADRAEILEMVRPDIPHFPAGSTPERLGQVAEFRDLAGRYSAQEAQVRLRPDLCPSVEEAMAEAAGYLDWVCCHKGCGCGE